MHHRSSFFRGYTVKTKLALTLMIVFLIIAGLYLHHSKNQQANFTGERKISGAYSALNFWSEQRAYPHGSIPNVSHYAAFEHSRQNIRKVPFRVEPYPRWQAIGPHNLGGRTLAVAFNPLNPGTIYAGSASGGLWRSYTGGRGANAWEYVKTGYPVLGVSSIAFAPDDSSTIYIATGEVYNYQGAGTGAAYRATRGTYGIGVLKTTNGGKTWKKSLDWSYNQQHGVWVVRVDPLFPSIVWAGTTEGTYKSTDAGNSWTQVHDVIMVTDLVINPDDPDIVFIACGNFESEAYGIYRTMDGGATWTKMTSELPETYKGKAMLAIYPSSPNIVYASIGNGFSSYEGRSWLCRTTDNGDSWTVRSTEDYSQWQGWFAHDVAINPTDPDEIIAVGINIWKSTDGGSTLSQISTEDWYYGRIPPEGPEGPPTYAHVDHHDVVYHPSNPDIIYFGNDGGIFRTVNGGSTYESCNGGYQTGQFYAGFSSSWTDSLLSIGGLQDNSTAIYDGQLAWKVRLIGGDGAWTAIDPGDETVMYGSWQYLSMVKSVNGGDSWPYYIPPPGSSRITCFIAPFVLAFDDPDILYAGRDIVYKSTTGGTSWSSTNSGSPLDGNPVLAMALSHQTSDVVYAATAQYYERPGVFRTTDGGETWDTITGELPDRYPGDLAVDPIDDATVYIVFSGFGTSHVFRSTDYGSHWEDIDRDLPDVPTSAIAIDPLHPDHLYIGNDIGVYVSTDGGTSWFAMRHGLPEAVIVMDLSISPLNRKLRIATHGNGAFEHFLIGDPTGIEKGERGATDSRLHHRSSILRQNHPNPFNPVTTIEYILPEAGKVFLGIYNVKGEKIRTLVDNYQNGGARAVRWDGTDDRGDHVPSGMYFYRVKTGDRSLIRKMMLVR
jgi:hypothetical protein